MFKKLSRYCINLFHPAIGEVWKLHRVTNEVAANVAGREYEITPQRLIALIEEYLSKGYHFISVEQLYAMHQSDNWEKKFVCVTLDDGYADNYEIAYPIFRQYNIPFCIFIAKDYIVNGYSSYKLMTPSQIVALSQIPLCTIGSHTLSHHYLNRLPQDKQYEEIRACKEWLEQLIELPVSYFAYPYGSFNDGTIAALEQCGIKMAFMAWGGPMRKKQSYNAFLIPRKLVKM